MLVVFFKYRVKLNQNIWCFYNSYTAGHNGWNRGEYAYSMAQAKVLAALPGDAQAHVGIARSLIALNELPLIDDANVDTYLAEARGVKAFYSLLSLDLFGVVLVKNDLNATSTIIRENEVVEYIKDELLAVEPMIILIKI